MTPAQLDEFRRKAKAAGKSNAEIETFIRIKTSPSATPAPFTPRVQSEVPFTMRQQPVQQQTPTSPITSPQIVKEVGKGFFKGVGSTISSLGTLGQKALDTIARPITEAVTGKPYQAVPTMQEVAGDRLKPTNTLQKVGFYSEQAAEFLLPSGAIGKLGKTIDIASSGLKVGKLTRAGIKIAGVAGLEAGTNAGIRYGQTGNVKEAGTAGLTAGIFSSASGLVGQALKSAKVPEWFYSKVFKTSYDDMLDELKSTGVANLKKTNPDLFNRLVKSGTVKLREGKVILNETLAKEALDRGLQGSIKNMANQVVKNKFELEEAAQMVTKNFAGTLKVEPQYVRLLQEVAEDYKVVGFGETSKEVSSILEGISNGQTTAENALKLRRFLDDMRIRSSFNPTGKLSQTQQNFKYLADTMRGRLAKEVPGLKPIMNEYRFNIEALVALAKEAARRNNREALGLLDTVLFGSGVAGGVPLAGAGIGVGRKLLTMPKVVTGIGQKINKIGTGRLSGKARAAAGLVPNAIRNNLSKKDQQPIQ